VRYRLEIKPEARQRLRELPEEHRRNIGRKRMNDADTVEKPTLESLAAEVRQIRERLEDMEDLMELRAAVKRNESKPGMPWEQVKAELKLD